MNAEKCTKLFSSDWEQKFVPELKIINIKTYWFRGTLKIIQIIILIGRKRIRWSQSHYGTSNPEFVTSSLLSPGWECPKNRSVLLETPFLQFSAVIIAWVSPGHGFHVCSFLLLNTSAPSIKTHCPNPNTDVWTFCCNRLLARPSNLQTSSRWKTNAPPELVMETCFMPQGGKG